MKQGVYHHVLWKRLSHTETTNTLGQKEAQEEQRPASASLAETALLSAQLCAAEAPIWSPLPPLLCLALAFKFGLLFPLPGSPPSLI